MSSLRDDGRPAGGLLTYSLRLAVAVLVIGIVVMLLVGPEQGGGERVATAGDAATAPQGGGRRAAAGPFSELVLRAGTHGHFMVEATVNGEPLRFMVDTGASAIYLTPDDAEQLGWPAHRLTFSERYDTAAGEVRAAPVTLRSLRIGQLELYDLPASIGEQPGSISLLGMTFLKRLESYQVRGDTLILTW